MVMMMMMIEIDLSNCSFRYLDQRWGEQWAASQKRTCSDSQHAPGPQCSGENQAVDRPSAPATACPVSNAHSLPTHIHAHLFPEEEHPCPSNY